MITLLTKEKFFALHRYFLYANKFRVLFDEELNLSDNNLQVFVAGDYGIYMSSWYSFLYVVLEGYEELRLSDEKIDNLLINRLNVDLLKKYRNGTFHYQKYYFDERFLNLIKEKGVVFWVRALHMEFSRFFLEYAKNYGNA